MLRQIASPVLSLFLVACIAPPPSPAPTFTPFVPPPTETPFYVGFSIEEAYRVDPLLRRDAVVNAVGRWLRNETIRAMDDATASAELTNAAFASARLTLTDPAFVRRNADGMLVVVGLPEGLGIVLYDLSQPNAAHAMDVAEISPGLSDLKVIWADDEAGVTYTTLGNDGITRAHFTLLVREENWRVTWPGDQQPDWWINAYNATVEAAPDLTWLIVTGEARESTLAFDESAGPVRQFRAEWVREQEQGNDLPSFRLKEPVEGYGGRHAWFWQTAVPSPYATLVELVERLQRNNRTGIDALVINPTAIDDATAFGLHILAEPYSIIEQTPDTITFRGRQGTLVVSFAPPATPDGPWLIRSIRPIGAVPTVAPTITPEG